MPSIELILVDVLSVTMALAASFSLARLRRSWVVAAVACAYGAAMGWVVQVALLRAMIADPLQYALLRLVHAGDWLPVFGAIAGTIAGVHFAAAASFPVAYRLPLGWTLAGAPRLLAGRPELTVFLCVLGMAVTLIGAAVTVIVTRG